MVTARGSCDGRALPPAAPAAPRAPPPRTLLGNVNSHLICVLCQGYYIDATTIVECLHTFCRSCIVKHLRVKSYCPVCEMMINSARPNIKLDKALQDIVYKLVPGLFQREMARRRTFYAARPELAADVTPEQRGEDTERIVFSPEDVISFSLEYADFADDPGSSGSSESGNEAPLPPPPPPPPPKEVPGGPTRRYLRCPAVVNVSHLKKFLSLKFDVDATHFFVDILYKRVPLPDYYTLMDIAYIYNWKRIEPMRFFYQITDFTAIRDRFGFLELGSAGGNGRGRGPAPLTEPPPSDSSSGSSSPPPDDALSCSKTRESFTESDDKGKPKDGDAAVADAANDANCTEKGDDLDKSLPADVEKSQFLNSFELTAKSSLSPEKGNAPGKDEPPKTPTEKDVKPEITNESKPLKPIAVVTEANSSAKRKSLLGPESNMELKKSKLENRTSPKAKQEVKPDPAHSSVLENLLTRVKAPRTNGTPKSDQKPAPETPPVVKPASDFSNSPSRSLIANNVNLQPTTAKVKKSLPMSGSSGGKHDIDAVAKKCKNSILRALSMKRKFGSIEGVTSRTPYDPPLPPVLSSDVVKEQPVKCEKAPTKTNQVSTPIPIVDKSIPKNNFGTVKTNIPTANLNVKSESTVKQLINKDPQKLSLKKPRKEGDPLKSLFNSCNINIPPSLSITLSDQKSEKQEETPKEIKIPETKPAQTLSNPISSNPSMQISSQPIITPQENNYLEIIKLPDVETPKSPEPAPTSKSGIPSTNKETVVTAKGPVPNLKPISEAKIAPFSKPQTFQQTFLQSLQRQRDRPKYSKTRLVLPKLNSAGSSSGKSDEISEPLPPSSPGNSIKPHMPPSISPIQNINFPKNIKSDSALDLSTPHSVQSQLGPQQAKALETMQSIAILAKKQCFNQRLSTSFSQDAFKANPSTSSLRVPVPTSNNSILKVNTSQSPTTSHKHFPEYFQPINQSNVRSSIDNNLMQTSKPQSAPSYTQTAERSQTRSPSCSPKLVIACPSPKSQSPEQKQFISPRSNEGNSQTSLISSSHISSTNVSSNNEPSGSKDISKIIKNAKPQPIVKLSNVRGPSASSKMSNQSNNMPGNDIMRGIPPQLIAQREYLRQQLALQTSIGLLPPGAAKQLYNNPVARAQLESIMKNMSQSQLQYGNSHSSKEKQ